MRRGMDNRWLALAIGLAAALPAAASPGSIAGTVTLSGGRSRLIVVYVEKGPEAPGKVAPAEKEMAQQDTEFRPEAMWVRAGDTVKFFNRDNFYHNVFSPTSGNDFDLGLYRGGVGKSVELSHPGEIDVYCNIHPNMKAKVLVVPDGRAADVGADGTYTLSALAPGDYTVVAWSASHEPVRREVRVRSGEPARADFTLKERGASAAHLNKNGEQYGRYR